MPAQELVMTGLAALWLPILVSSVLVFVVSSAIHMASPWHKSDYAKVPNLVLTVIPNGPWSMRQSLTLWFLYAVVVGAFAGYVAGRALPSGAEFGRVFRFAGVTAFVGYAVALWQMSIWYRRAWTTTIKASVDGVIYALLTAAAFGWLWPR